MQWKKSMASLKKSLRLGRATRVRKIATRVARKATERPILLVVIGVVAAGLLISVSRPGMPGGQASDVRLEGTPAANGAAVDTAIPDIAARPSDAKSAPVTITGCLERNDETFRLKDTTGLDAPRARSWKTGFLKKSAATIQVIDATNRVRLPNHVGERVAVTGILNDREMQVRSLQRISMTCAKSKV